MSEGYVDPTPTRVDYMKFKDMSFIHAVVEDVRTLSVTHTDEEMERHVNAVITEVDDHFGGKLSSDTYHKIVLLLRRLTHFVKAKPNEDTPNTIYANSITNRIIELIQGDNKMDKNQLISMTFRRVKEAIETVGWDEHGAPTDEAVSTIAEEYASKIVYDVFSGKMLEELQTTEFVNKNYLMDPATEDVLHNGTLLVDGMKVLIESPMYREHIADDMNEGDIVDAKMKNRWCTVEHAKIENFGNGPMITFVGVYDDGVKRKWNTSANHAWIVKKDSIPRFDTLMTLNGQILEALPTAKMVEFLKDRIKFYSAFDAKQMKIETGIDGDVIPLEDYLVAEGVMAGTSEETSTTREFGSYSLILGGPTSKEFASRVYEVFESSDGDCVLVGASDDVLAWAEEMHKQTGDYDGFTVRRGDGFEDVELAEFVRKHNG